VILATQELPVHLELLVHKVPGDRMASRVTREQPAHEVRQAPRVRLGPRGRPVSQDSKVLRVMPDKLVQLVNQVHRASPVMSELVEHQARLEPLAPRARQEPRARRDPVVNRDQLDSLVQLVRLVQRVEEERLD
jgi:hypothetical protein